MKEEGARFRSYVDGDVHLLSPESSIAMQQVIGSDIMMALDQCIPSTAPYAEAEAAMELTHRWARRSLAARGDSPAALFGIVQGACHHDLRKKSAAFLRQLPFDGLAIGGLAVGETHAERYEFTGLVTDHLPSNLPRYLMGVGTPIDLIECVNAGVDMFDCIIPGKMAQQGYAYTFEGQLRLSRTEYRLSDEPLDKTCGCPVCKRYTRGYLRHLTQGTHHLASRLLTEHNIWHYQALMKRMRDAIVAGRWEAEYRTLRELLAPQTSQPRPVSGSKDGEFELVTLKSGARAVRHTGHGEVMHPVGPWQEANQLYVDQTRLKERLSVASEEPLRILDVGLGAATNAVAALECIKQMGSARKRSVELVSLEVDLTPVRLALADPEGFPFLQPWKEPLDILLKEECWEIPGLSWRLMHGDAGQTLNEVDGVFDIIFFDPFSPESNPALWTVPFLKAVRTRAKNRDCVLATYSAATPTRVSLLLAGFFVGHGVATGTRTETTIAATRKDGLDNPLADRWYVRWRRSSARGPHGQELSPELEAAVRAHPQFVGMK
jgi:queuine tRNA-ribosyltransferase